MISHDNQRMMWFSRTKRLKNTTIFLSDIIELRPGQNTKTFARHPAPELAKSSFSIIYKNGKRTLDLIAKDPNEYRIWTTGLRAMLDKLKTVCCLSLIEAVFEAMIDSVHK